MPLGIERLAPRPSVFLFLDVRFGKGNVGLSRIEIARRMLRRARHAGRSNRLSGIAHFLHRGATTPHEARYTDRY